MFSSSDCLGYSNADGLKYTLRCNRLLGLQEFQVIRTATHKHMRAHTHTHRERERERERVREMGVDTGRQLARSVVNGRTFQHMLPAHSAISIPLGVPTFAHFGAMIS